MYKRSNSSKPRLKLIYGGKKDRLRVLLGDIEDNIFQNNMLSSILKEIYSEKYDIKIMSSEYADEILQLRHQYFVYTPSQLYRHHDWTRYSDCLEMTSSNQMS